MGSLGRLGRLAWAATPRRHVTPGEPAGPGTLLGIYRARRADRIRAVAGLAGRAGWDVRLWGLDDDAPEVPGLVGRGPGSRTVLLNRLAADAGPGALLVCDDDVDGAARVLAAVAIAQRLGLDLAQPAMTWDSEFSHPVTACRPWLVARETTFVEIGPVLHVGARARDVVFPMDESLGMGWGSELDWYDAITAGRIRAGIVDAAPVRHLGAVGAGYGRAEEHALLDERLRARGLRSLRPLQRTTRRYWRQP